MSGATKKEWQEKLSKVMNVDLRHAHGQGRTPAAFLRDLKLPEDYQSRTKLCDPVLLQVISVKNVSVPAKKQKTSDGQPRTIHVKLTDGTLKCTATDATSSGHGGIEGLGINTPPGTKLIVTSARVFKGKLVIDAESASVLGGVVKQLVREWNKQKGVEAVFQSDTSFQSGEQPPPFVKYNPNAPVFIPASEKAKANLPQPPKTTKENVPPAKKSSRTEAASSPAPPPPPPSKGSGKSEAKSGGRGVEVDGRPSLPLIRKGEKGRRDTPLPRKGAKGEGKGGRGKGGGGNKDKKRPDTEVDTSEDAKGNGRSKGGGGGRDKKRNDQYEMDKQEQGKGSSGRSKGGGSGKDKDRKRTDPPVDKDNSGSEVKGQDKEGGRGKGGGMGKEKKRGDHSESADSSKNKIGGRGKGGGAGKDKRRNDAQSNAESGESKGSVRRKGSGLGKDKKRNDSQAGTDTGEQQQRGGGKIKPAASRKKKGENNKDKGSLGSSGGGKNKVGSSSHHQVHKQQNVHASQSGRQQKLIPIETFSALTSGAVVPMGGQIICIKAQIVNITLQPMQCRSTTVLKLLQGNKSLIMVANDCYNDKLLVEVWPDLANYLLGLPLPTSKKEKGKEASSNDEQELQTKLDILYRQLSTGARVLHISFDHSSPVLINISM